MSKYRMDDNTIVDTTRATHTWEEDSRWDGSNHISVATGSQWDHEDLYRSRKGRYYIVHSSQWQGSTPCAEWISHRAAAAWLLNNAHEIPAELADTAELISE
jgi:hypothetical protein